MNFYKDINEQLPKDAPEALGESTSVEMTSYIHSDHACDKVNWRSRAGVLIFLNRAHIVR